MHIKLPKTVPCIMIFSMCSLLVILDGVFIAIDAFLVSSCSNTNLSLLSPYSYSVFVHSCAYNASKQFSTIFTVISQSSSLPLFIEFMLAFKKIIVSYIFSFLLPTLESVRFFSVVLYSSSNIKRSKMFLKIVTQKIPR